MSRQPKELAAAFAAVLDNAAIAIEENEIGVLNLAVLDHLKTDFRRAAADGAISHAERVRLLKAMRLLERGLTRAYGLDVEDLTCIRAAAGHLDRYSRRREAAWQSDPSSEPMQLHCIGGR